ncbi:uncharacterized protein N7484_008081 [Penicillium longicatenatum]|uniref:uncharacterized protein n=1 Tax=Penicillium longicatenatum TaxID=1561947 RepID=UPI0025484955|nr:uncharacterized protein N7484_008081 [Penicillium longicatenatum]KAJ5640219.1 hypothetical protein N7484_008081 [Penicillium longicatenatum]
MVQSGAEAALASNGQGLVILSVIEGSVALCLLIARMYTTWRITRHIRSDLFLSLVTFIIGLVGTIFLALGVNSGLGAHKANLTETEITHAIKWNWINQSLGILATATGKLAIVAFLQQIHGPESRKKVNILWGIAISNLIVNCITIVLIWTQCDPSAKLWNNGLPGSCEGRLRNQQAAYFQGSYSALCDLILALYPVMFFWNVRLNPRVKIGLCCLMGLGVAACVCAIVKTTTLRVLEETEDVTYYMAQLIILNETEKWVVFIVGCIPPIRPLLMIVFHRILTSAKSTIGQSHTNQLGRSTELHSYSHSKPRARHMTSNLVSVLEDKDNSEINLAEEGGIMKTTEVRLSYEAGSSNGTTSTHNEHALEDVHLPVDRV